MGRPERLPAMIYELEVAEVLLMELRRGVVLIELKPAAIPLETANPLKLRFTFVKNESAGVVPMIGTALERNIYIHPCQDASPPLRSTGSERWSESESYTARAK